MSNDASLLSPNNPVTFYFIAGLFFILYFILFYVGVWELQQNCKESGYITNTAVKGYPSRTKGLWEGGGGEKGRGMIGSAFHMMCPNYSVCL